MATRLKKSQKPKRTFRFLFVGSVQKINITFLVQVSFFDSIKKRGETNRVRSLSATNKSFLK